MASKARSQSNFRYRGLRQKGRWRAGRRMREEGFALGHKRECKYLSKRNERNAKRKWSDRWRHSKVSNLTEQARRVILVIGVSVRGDL